MNMPLHDTAVLAPALSSQLVCKNLVLSEDAYTANRGHGCSQAVVMGSAPLERQAGGLYFEVRVNGTVDATAGGLAIGVTHTAPEELAEVPGKAKDVPLTFAIGYDGLAYLNGCEKQLGWNPERLQIGQRVGLLITDDGRGDLIVFEDLKPVVQISGVALRDAGLMAGPLYPLVDLFGSTSVVILAPTAVPPSQRWCPLLWDHLEPAELEPLASDMLQSTRAVTTQPPAADLLLQSTRQVV